ncbi:protein phosphatase 1 regulatory subunit 1C isoform X3 [Perognathus longimembris pacificus]|uniref:protein phosphatase 1 regulatory subunit 1C isoform X3 n=1 Tax=Perognathus longimembris pacificus TaxID=214514 RepID=UPI002019C6C3|nr:protein phosphatase 1 regulatory subunit 1C isoform X3 [Perognathus longimembris pacificus]
MEPNSPKKIQFAVPLFQSQIAPEAAEQIRKRRPTPASLVILNESNPPGVKHLKGQNESAFPEEEEGINEKEEPCDH